MDRLRTCVLHDATSTMEVVVTRDGRHRRVVLRCMHGPGVEPDFPSRDWYDSVRQELDYEDSVKGQPWL